MKTTAAIFAALTVLAGCSYFDRRPEPPAQSEQARKIGPPVLDQSCMNDCLGGSTDAALCEGRCKY